MKRLQRIIAMVLSVCLINISMVQAVHAAGMVSTEQVARLSSNISSESGHSRLNAVLARADVRTELQRLGVSPTAAAERVAALTDVEASRLADQIDSAPAAGLSFFEGALILFFVLMMTDWLGLTKIFPFTRTAR